jgi:hypothetical protein
MQDTPKTMLKWNTNIAAKHPPRPRLRPCNLGVGGIHGGLTIARWHSVRSGASVAQSARFRTHLKSKLAQSSDNFDDTSNFSIFGYSVAHENMKKNKQKAFVINSKLIA